MAVALPALRPLHLAAYVVSALLLAAYGVVMWWMIHPNVPDNYRAYYIDRSSTCLDQPVSGRPYVLGTTVSFQDAGREQTRQMKPCGWEGPAGDGTHAVGTSSRIRMTYAQQVSGPLNLVLDMIAVKKNGKPMPQSVDIIVNGEHLATVKVGSIMASHFRVKLPANLVQAAKGRIDVLFEFPDAVQMGDTDPPSRWRSIKLLNAGLFRA